MWGGRLFDTRRSADRLNWMILRYLLAQWQKGTPSSGSSAGYASPSSLLDQQVKERPFHDKTSARRAFDAKDDDCVLRYMPKLNAIANFQEHICYC